MSNASPATFEEYIKSTPVSVRCKVCKFFKAQPTEAEGIRDAIKRRGMSITALDSGQGQHVTPKQIAAYAGTKYPEYKLSISNVYDHWRNGHEERA